MAFEYMLTYYLLTRDLGNFLRQLPRTDGFPGMKLPPLWQEALLTALYKANKQVEDPRITPEVRNRFQEFMNIARKNGTDQTRAQYGNTYFFYYFFHE
jgi:hypothetical protein